MESLSRNIQVAGVDTTILIQQYVDRILVLVSQLNKVGSLIQASLPAAIPLPSSSSSKGQDPDVPALPPPSPGTELTPLLSSAPTEHIQTLHNIYASQIATLLWTAEADHGVDERRPVILGIALKKTDGSDEAREQETFAGVMNVVQSILKGKV